MKRSFLAACIFLFGLLSAQTNVSLSNPQALQVLKGNYQPSTYAASKVISASNQIACEINNLVSADSIEAHLRTLVSFGTRHTWSDTLSNTHGMGAARRWALQKMQSFSQQNDNRLVVSYLNFDILSNSCGQLYDTKNVLGILPGSSLNDSSIVLIQAHMDSRCDVRCDTACPAPGADDNGSGSTLVLELARVISRYTFDHTIVFMLTTGEEQGLLGAEAFANLVGDENIPMKGVLNNDIVGGVICGETASPPGCTTPGTIDSTHVRLYANPLSFRNPHQGFARTIKLFYEEKLRSNVAVPMEIDIINQEDRTGRGGDHIPFREIGVRNTRFTSSHEHGNGNPLGTPNYQDHQHTSNDVIGEDTDNDNKIDSFFVDFNYLSRNAVINGVSAAFLASGPDVPEITLHDEAGGLRVEVTGNFAPEYRVGIKESAGTEFDSIFRFSGTSFVVPGQRAGTPHYIAVAAIDSNGIMSHFTQDERRISQATTAPGTPDNLPYGIDCSVVGFEDFQFVRPESGLQLLPPRPNPLQRTADLVILVNDNKWIGKEATLVVLNTQGQPVSEHALELKRGANSLRYEHAGASGLYHYYLAFNNSRVSSTQRMMVN